MSAGEVVPLWVTQEELGTFARVLADSKRRLEKQIDELKQEACTRPHWIMMQESYLERTEMLLAKVRGLRK